MTKTIRSPAPERPPSQLDHEMVLASMLGGVVVLSTTGTVEYVNPAAEALLGHSGRVLAGKRAEALFRLVPWLADLIRRVQEGPDQSLRDEGPVRGSPDTRILAVVSVLRDRDGHVHGTLVALHDLGSRQRMLGDEQTRTRLAELDRLVASVGHELNNPLSGIRGAAQLLSKKLTDKPELGEYAAMIVRQVDRMSTLIRNLMELEAPVPAMEPLNIHRVLHEVILLEQATANSSGVRITTEFDPSLPEVIGNADQLQQLFLNLIKNAIAASPSEGGRVRIGTRIENHYYVETGTRRLRYIAIEVSDDGPGLDAEALEHMFTPFFSQTPGGHGLGLSIARNIATAHRGHLHGSNIEGGGACFRLLLPVAEPRRVV